MRDSLSLQSITIPPDSAIIFKNGAEHNDEKNEHVNECALSSFSEDRQNFKHDEGLNLSFDHHSMKYLSLALEFLTRPIMMNHIIASYSLGTRDLMNISNEFHPYFAWNAYHAGLGTALSLRRPTYSIAIEPRISSKFLLAKNVLESQKLLLNMVSMQHSTDSINERQMKGEINARKDYIHSEIFPVKLHRLLLGLDQKKGGGNIACFVLDGKAFVIIDRYRFEREVMKKHFPRMSSYASFQKQLNLYGFRRICFGSSGSAYYHALFLRKFPSMCVGIKRIKEKEKMRNVKTINL
jgi:hypothetical protein